MPLGASIEEAKEVLRRELQAALDQQNELARRAMLASGGHSDRAYLVKLRAQLRDLADRQGVSISTGKYSDLLEDAFKAGAKDGKAALGEVDPKILDLAVNNAEVRVKGILDDGIKIVNEEMVKATLGTSNLADISERLQSKLTLADGGGIQQWRADLIAGTELHSVYRQAQVAAGKANGVEWYEYAGPDDNRTEPICSAYVGKVLTLEEWRRISEQEQGDPEIIFLYGLHYGCRHTLKPAPPPEGEEETQGEEPEEEQVPPEEFDAAATEQMMAEESYARREAAYAQAEAEAWQAKPMVDQTIIAEAESKYLADWQAAKELDVKKKAWKKYGDKKAALTAQKKLDAATAALAKAKEQYAAGTTSKSVVTKWQKKYEAALANAQAKGVGALQNALPDFTIPPGAPGMPPPPPVPAPAPAPEAKVSKGSPEETLLFAYNKQVTEYINALKVAEKTNDSLDWTHSMNLLGELKTKAASLKAAGLKVDGAWNLHGTPVPASIKDVAPTTPPVPKEQSPGGPPTAKQIASDAYAKSVTEYTAKKNAAILSGTAEDIDATIAALDKVKTTAAVYAQHGGDIGVLWGGGKAPQEVEDFVKAIVPAPAPSLADAEAKLKAAIIKGEELNALKAAGASVSTQEVNAVAQESVKALNAIQAAGGNVTEITAKIKAEVEQEAQAKQPAPVGTEVGTEVDAVKTSLAEAYKEFIEGGGPLGPGKGWSALKIAAGEAKEKGVDLKAFFGGQMPIWKSKLTAGKVFQLTDAGGSQAQLGQKAKTLLAQAKKNPPVVAWAPTGTLDPPEIAAAKAKLTAAKAAFDAAGGPESKGQWSTLKKAAGEAAAQGVDLKEFFGGQMPYWNSPSQEGKSWVMGEGGKTSTLTPTAQVQAAASGAPAPAPAPPVQPIEPGAPMPTDPGVILGQKIKEPTGSNTGGQSGSWMGTDGVLRYVKEYANPDQARGEVLANEIYRSLGIRAPKSTMFQTKEGKWAIATDWQANKGELGKIGITKERALKVLEGTPADILLGNRDAVGLNHDNVVFDADGNAWRIDQGGALLFKAQGAEKSENALGNITEWEYFTTGKTYKKVFDAAGVDRTDAIPGIWDKVKQIESVQATYGSWTNRIAMLHPDWDPNLVKRLGDVLDTRTALLKQKRIDHEAEAAAQTAQAKGVPAGAPPSTHGSIYPMPEKGASPKGKKIVENDATFTEMTSMGNGWLHFGDPGSISKGQLDYASKDPSYWDCLETTWTAMQRDYVDGMRRMQKDHRSARANNPNSDEALAWRGMKEYTAGNYERINLALQKHARGEPLDSSEKGDVKYVAAMSKYFSKSTGPDFVVFRGEGSSSTRAARWGQTLKGLAGTNKVISQNRLLSTSIKENVARGWGGFANKENVKTKTAQNSFRETGYLFEITVKQGCPGIYVAPVSSSGQGEREFIIGADARYKVTSMTKVYGGWLVKMEAF